MRRLSLLLAIASVAVTAAVLAQVLVRAQTGPLPLVGVFEVHLLVLATVLAAAGLPGALGGGRGRAWLRLALVGVVVLAIVRIGDELWSPGTSEVAAASGPGDGAAAPGGGGTELRVLEWNLQFDSKTGDQAVDGIASTDADVVALVELTPAYARAIDASDLLRSRYPYRILDPSEGAAGLGVLTKAPLLVRPDDERMWLLRAGLLLPDGRTAELFIVHASRPPFETTLSIPDDLDTTQRDADLAHLRELIDGLDDPASVLLAGDVNATPLEAGLGALDGLTDAHRAVGLGPGFTWRPESMAGSGLALLRIDEVRTGAWFAPLATAVDCAAPGDHCRLSVALRVEPAGR